MTVQFVPPRVPLVDPRTGLITREWYRLFQSLFRMGGGVDDSEAWSLLPAPSFDAVFAALSVRQDAAELSPPTLPPSPCDDDLSPPEVPLFVAIDDVLPVIGALRDEIAALRRLVDDLQKGPGL